MPLSFRSAGLAALVLLSATGGGLSASAQTPGGVVIRERVEVAPPAAAPLMHRDDDQVMMCPVDRSAFTFFYSPVAFCRPPAPAPFEDPALVQFEITAGNAVTSTPVSTLFVDSGQACSGGGTLFLPTHAWSYGTGNHPFLATRITAGDTLRVRAIGGQGRRIDLDTYSTCSQQSFFTPNNYVRLKTERLDVTDIHAFNVYPAFSWNDQGYPNEWGGDVAPGDTVGIGVQARDVDGHWTWTESFIALLPDVPLVVELDTDGARYGHLIFGTGTGDSVSGVYTENVEHARALRYVLDGDTPPAEGDSVTVTVYRADQPSVRGQARLRVHSAVPSPPKRFEVHVTPGTVPQGGSTTVAAIARDASGREATLSPSAQVKVWAYEGIGSTYGTVTNTRTGDHAVRVLVVPYADVRAGRVSIRATQGAPARGVDRARTVRHRTVAPDTSSGSVYRGRPVAGASGVDPAPSAASLASPEAEVGGEAETDAPAASLTGNEVVYVDVEMGNYAVYGYFDLVVTPGDPSLTLTATPDTLSAGGEAHFTIAAPGLDPATPMTFSVSDLTLGGFIPDVPVARGTARRNASVERVLSVTRTLSEASEVRFLAADSIQTTSVVTVTASGGGRTGTANVTVLSPSLRLLSPNDSLYTRDFLMVSRFSPSSGLPASVGFQAPATDRARRTWYDPFSQPLIVPQPLDAVDLYTVRPEVEGIPTGQTVTFRLRVERSGATVLSEDFPGLEGVVGGGTRYRADRLIRFVATEHDDAEGTTSPDQTPRVRLGDLVQFYALLDGVQFGDTLQLRISLPPISGPESSSSQDDRLTERHAVLNWRWYSGARNVAPELTAARASEVWAQAAIRFENRLPDGAADPAWGAFDLGAVRNIVNLQYQPAGLFGNRKTNIAPGDGEFRVVGEVGGSPRVVSVPFTQGASLLQKVRELAAAVQSSFGVPVVWFQDAVNGSAAEASTEFVPLNESIRFYLVIGRSNNAEVVISDGDTSSNAILRREIIPVTNKLSLHHLAGLSAAQGDGDPSTIEVIVVPDRSLPDSPGAALVLGKGIGDLPTGNFCVDPNPAGGCTTYNPLVNSLFVYDEHVDTAPDYPTVVPHELGHVLAGGDHPAVGGPGGSVQVGPAEQAYQMNHLFRPRAPLTENLMFGAASASSSSSQQRRLDWKTMFFARVQGLRGLPVLH